MVETTEPILSAVSQCARTDVSARDRVSLPTKIDGLKILPWPIPIYIFTSEP